MTWLYIVLFTWATYMPTNPGSPCLCDSTQNYITAYDSVKYELLNRQVAIQVMQSQLSEVGKLYPPNIGEPFKMMLSIKIDSIQIP